MSSSGSSTKLSLNHLHLPPGTNDLSHVPLQGVKDGGFHYVVPGRKLMQAFLLDLSVIFSLSIILLLLLVVNAMSQAVLSVIQTPYDLT